MDTETTQPQLLTLPTYGVPIEKLKSSDSEMKSPEETLRAFEIQEATQALIVRMHSEYSHAIPATLERMTGDWAAVFLRADVPPERLAEFYDKVCTRRRREGFGRYMPTAHEIAAKWEAENNQDAERTSQMLDREAAERAKGAAREYAPESETARVMAKYGKNRKAVTA